MLFGALFCAVAFAGCAHYQLGTSEEKPLYHSISFAPVKNNSFAPQIDTLLSDALFRSFARGGGMAVEAQGGGEVVLQVVINDFQKLIGAYSSEDTGRARSLVMIMNATVRLSTPEGVVIYSEEFEARHETYADSGLALAENQAMPQLAEDLAQKIYRTVVAVW